MVARNFCGLGPALATVLTMLSCACSCARDHCGGGGRTKCSGEWVTADSCSRLLHEVDIVGSQCPAGLQTPCRMLSDLARSTSITLNQVGTSA
jgi:hypothetical protein